MKIKRALLPAVALLMTLASSSSFAVTLGFNGYYDYATWTTSSSLGNPVVYSTIDGPQQTLTLYEGDYCGSGGPCSPGEELFSHTVEATGTVAFDWIFDSSIDACCSGMGFYVNATRYTLAGGDFGAPYGNPGDHPYASGSFSIAVSAGDTIAFSAFTADNCCLASSNIVYNFDAPVATPEPVSLALLGLGLAGLGFTRRRGETGRSRSVEAEAAR